MDVTPISGMLGLIAETGNAYALYSDLAHTFDDETNALAEALAADLRCAVHRSTPVRAVEQHAHGVEVRTREATFPARWCVMAIPVNVLPDVDLSPALAPDALEPLRVGHACRVTKLWIRATGAPDRLLGAGWDTPLHWLAGRGTEADGTQLVVAFALEGRLDPGDRKAVQAALRGYAPGAEVLAVQTHDWNAGPYARGGWATASVGWASADVQGHLGAPLGRVLFAGSDIAPEFSCWMAGAIASGQDVAERVRRLRASEPS